MGVVSAESSLNLVEFRGLSSFASDYLTAVSTCKIREIFGCRDAEESHVDGEIEDELGMELSYSLYLLLSTYLFPGGYIQIISS